jgi:hypothetical protein
MELREFSLSKFKYYILVQIVLLTSCLNKEKDVTISSLPIKEFAEAEFDIEVDGSIYGHLIELNTDTILLVSSLQTQELYHIYDLRTHRKISTFGNTGQGPTEIRYPLHIYDSSLSHVFRYNPSLATLGSFTFEQILTSDLSDGYSKSVELPRELLSVRDVFFLSDSTLVGTYDDHFNKRLDSNRGVFTFQTNTKDFANISLTNFTVEPNDVMGATNVNARTSTFSRDRGVLLIASVHNPILEIYNSETSLIESHVIFPEFGVTESFKLDDFKNGVLTQYFTFVDHSDNYIYLLYHGYSESESRVDQRIIILNWRYEPVYVIRAPNGYQISSFQVSKDDSFLIAHSIQNDSFYKFLFSKN